MTGAQSPAAPASTGERLYRWLDARFGLGRLVEFARHKEVPVGGHSMVWYYLGGATLFFFTVQLASGVLLLMYYQAGEQTSYESIRYITTKVPFGWLVRSIHCWSAHLMIVALVVHMFSTMMLKAYRRPRELTWLTGFVLFAIALGFGFSGYLLPWNELAFFATAVGTDSVKSVPVIGQWLLEVMRGGPDVTINTLYRFFALHVVILPLVMVAVVSTHLLFIQVQGMAKPMAHQAPSRPGLRFFPDFLLRDLLLWLVCLIVLSVLVYLLPYGPGIPGMEWELGKKANPLAPAYPGIKPEWYFLWVYQLLKEFPAHLFGMEGPQAALLVVTVLMGIWALVPWLDRRAAKGLPSPMFTDLAIAAIIFMAYLTLKAWDIGGKSADPSKLPDARATAWTCAWIVLGVSSAIAVLRILAYRQRWMFFSGAALLQVVLNGVFGVDYLIAGAVALVVVIAGVVLTSRKSPAARLEAPR
ncbi:MAG TPA: cytochrome bc complex cytochrome b subunit [Myxococcaceae bacterium]|nr:cytochrome bc complex cytochrome b subunit [Myxococcaceae bacterium]